MLNIVDVHKFHIVLQSLLHLASSPDPWLGPLLENS